LIEELVDVIDVQGQSVDCVDRGDVRANRLLHRAIAVACRDPFERIFVHRRSATKDLFPGMYDMFVSGVVMAGESFNQAARRELAEELGIVGATPRWLFEHLYLGEHDRCLIGVYEVTWNGPVRLQRSEISMGGFATLERVRALMAHKPFVPDSLEVFRSVCGSISCSPSPARRGTHRLMAG
jgi:isopentenyldiphosphate isomerase